MANDIVRHNATELSVTQLSAIAALASGSNVTDAAAKAKVDRTTVHRWLADDPEFVAAVNRAKQDALDAIRAEVQAGAADAIKAVRKIVTGTGVGPAVRLRAAMALLQSSGALIPETIGPTDPEDIRAENNRRAHSRMLANLLG